LVTGALVGEKILTFSFPAAMLAPPALFCPYQTKEPTASNGSFRILGRVTPVGKLFRGFSFPGGWKNLAHVRSCKHCQ
jgi:hypothetical protein